MEINTPQIPGYKIEREIGRGGMAIVYLAQQESLARYVSLKLLSPALSMDKQFTDRFLKEKSIVAQLSHPNIVEVYDFGSYQGLYYLAMEYLGGGSLEDKLEKNSLSVAEAIQTTKEISQALGFAHSRGYIHRDIKPGNILFRDNGIPVLTDFGIAKFLDSTGTKLTAPGMIVGSPHYMSPEQIRGQTIDLRSDIYSLGILLFQMLAGELPYDADNLVALATRHTNDPIPDLPENLAQYNPVLKKALAKHADDRFASMDSFVQALEQAEYGNDTPELAQTNISATKIPDTPSISKRIKNSISSQQPKSPAQPQTQTNKRPVLIMVFSLLLVSLGVGGYLFKDRFTDQPQQQIAQILQLAQQAQQDGDFEDSLRLIYQGLQIVNDEPKLLALRDTVETQRQQQLTAQLQQRQANERLADAQTAYDAGDLDKSQRLIAQGLKLVADHPALLALAETVQAKIDERADRQKRLAKVDELIRQANQTTDLQKKLDLVDEGMRLMPNHPELQALYTTVLTAKLELRTRQEQLAAIRREANALLQRGQYDESLSQIEQGLQLEPDDAQLLALQETVAAEKTTQLRKQQRINELLAQARQAEQADQLEQSLQLINAGLDIKADDKELLAARKRLEQRITERAAAQRRQQQIQQYTAQAQQAQQAGELEQSLALINQGLQIDASHPPLLRLRDEIKTQQQQRAAAKRLRLEIETLLIDVKFAQLQGNYEKALEQTQQGLQLDPANPQLLELQQTLNQQIAEQAEAELQQQVAALLNQAQQAQQAGNFNQSLAYIEQGLAMMPEQAEFISLRSTVLDQMQARRLAAAALADAEQARVAGLFDDSLAFIRDGLKQIPNDAALIDLRNRVEAEKTQALANQQRQQIADILAQATQVEQADDLQTALAILEQGLTQLPDATELSDLQKTIANELAQREQRTQRVAGLFEQAQQAQQRNAFGDSIALLDEGLRLSPDDQRLLGLLKTVETQQQRQQQLQNYADDATEQLKRGKLEASLALIEQGLQVDPASSELLRLQQEAFELQRIEEQQQLEQKVDELVAEAEKSFAAGDLEQTRALLDQGLAMLPENPALLALNKQLLQQLNAASELDQLFEKAEQQITAKLLTSPKGNNAYETYQKILALAPNNEQAERGLENIASIYLSWARNDLNRNNPDRALIDIKKGLSVMPQQAELLALREQANAELATFKARNAERQAKERAERERLAKIKAEKDRRAAEQAQAAEKKRLADQLRAEQERRAAAERAERARQAANQQSTPQQAPATEDKKPRLIGTF